MLESVVLIKERETKGAILYKAQDSAAGQAVTSIYLRKDGISGPIPLTIQLTIEVLQPGE